jgi:uncharacterized membrane protein
MEPINEQIVAWMLMGGDMVNHVMNGEVVFVINHGKVTRVKVLHSFTEGDIKGKMKEKKRRSA